MCGEYIRDKEVKIRKDRRCFTCERIFLKGSNLLYVLGKDGRSFVGAYYCQDCVEIMNKYPTEDCYYGGDFREYYHDGHLKSGVRAKGEES